MTAHGASPPSRAALNRGWLRVASLAALVLCVLSVRTALAWERSWYVSINWTESLPFWAFVVDRNAEPQVGDYVEFWPPENRHYSGVAFVKRIVAGPGDEVTCVGRRFFVGGVEVARAKTVSRDGDPLGLGPCGVVPDGRFFVVTPHTDSFDSRYKEIGYVSRDRVRGVARPVL